MVFFEENTYAFGVLFQSAEMRDFAEKCFILQRETTLLGEGLQSLKSCGQKWLCGFKSRPGYNPYNS